MEDSTSTELPALPKRLIQVFLSPGELFSALRDKPVWFGALSVAVVLAGLAVALIPTEMWLEISRNRLIEQGQEVPASLDATGPIIRIGSVVAVVLVSFLMAFVLSGILTFFFSFLFGGEGRYVQYLSVVAHASVISTLGALLMVPLRISQGDPQATLSLGTYAFFLDEGYFLRVLKMIDLFALWSYGVMAIGVTMIDPRRSLGFAVSFFVAFALAFALVFGIFTG